MEEPKCHETAETRQGSSGRLGQSPKSKDVPLETTAEIIHTPAFLPTS